MIASYLVNGLDGLTTYTATPGQLGFPACLTGACLPLSFDPRTLAASQVPARDITIQDLLRHTSGLTYEFRGSGPVQKMYMSAKVYSRSQSNADQVATLSKLPLIKAPVLVMHSRADGLIRFQQSQWNFAAANEPKLFCELEGEHNDPLTNRARFIADNL